MENRPIFLFRAELKGIEPFMLDLLVRVLVSVGPELYMQGRHGHYHR